MPFRVPIRAIQRPEDREILGFRQVGRQLQELPTLLMMALCRDHMHYNFMSKSITIRDVPDETGDELAARAALTGRSLQEYLRAQLIELAERPDPDVLIARLRARKQSTGSRISTEAILTHRDADRR
jgi:antitoxin FitA